MFQSNAFGEYINFYSVPMMNVASIDAMKNMLEDYIDLNIKDNKYGYFEERRAYLNEHYAMVLMSPPSFPPLEPLKNRTKPLAAEDVLKTGVDEDFYFQKVDNAGMVCVLGLPITSPTPLSSPQDP